MVQYRSVTGRVKGPLTALGQLEPVAGQMPEKNGGQAEVSIRYEFRSDYEK